MLIVERKCPSCDQDNHSELKMSYAPKDWPMKQCTSCNLVYLEKAPDVKELFENLSWEKTTKIEDVRRDQDRPLERKLSKLTRKRLHMFPRKKPYLMIQELTDGAGAVLDVGCGPGDYVLHLPQPYVPYGIEISKSLAELKIEEFKKRGGKIVNADALNGLKQLDADTFSGIIMRSFLEHELNPLEVLQEAERTLVKGGVLIIKVPNYACWNRRLRGPKWCGFRFPDHLNYFTPSSLEEIVKRAGLSVKKFGFFDKLPTSDNMWMIVEKR